MDEHILNNPKKLREFLKTKMDNRTIFSYNAARKHLYTFGDKTLYGKDGESDQHVFDSTKEAYEHDFTCEHIVPQSFYDKRYPMVSDLHHLYPADKRLNTLRCNYKFCELDKNEYSGVEVNTKTHSFEPSNISKGNIARAIAYFDVLYEGEVELEKIIDIETLLIWNFIDPVDKIEAERNNKICETQGNSNIFIEYPDLIYCVYADVFNRKSEIRLDVDHITNIIESDIVEYSRTKLGRIFTENS